MLHDTNTQNMAPWCQYKFSIWYENFDDQTKKSVGIWPGIEWDKGEPDITCMGPIQFLTVEVHEWTVIYWYLSDILTSCLQFAT